MTLKELQAAWNAQADAMNSWDELGMDEIVEFAQWKARDAAIDECAEKCRELAEGEDNPQEYRDGANWCRERILALKHTN